MKKSLLIFISLVSLASCSPLYMLALQNNTEEPIEIYVELKNEKYNKNTKNIFEKRELYNYKRLKNIDEFSLDSLNYNLKMNKVSSKKYFFTSDLNYNFSLEPGTLTNIDPNNGISIYPFEKVYYIKEDKKCVIVPKDENNDCNYKIIKKKRLKKNQTVKTYIDFIEIK